MVVGGARDAVARLAVGVEVRHHMRDIIALALGARATRAMHLDLAEIRGEQELLLARERLVGKDDDMMREERCVDRRRVGRRQRLREVDAAELDTARRRQPLADLWDAPTPTLARMRGSEFDAR